MMHNMLCFSARPSPATSFEQPALIIELAHFALFSKAKPGILPTF